MNEVRDEVTRPTRRILHTTDFSAASEIAFVHALKLAVAAQAEIDVLHATAERTTETWTEFPGIRDTLRRWADEGRIEAFTTAGGHRRFHRATVHTLANEPALVRSEEIRVA